MNYFKNQDKTKFHDKYKLDNQSYSHWSFVEKIAENSTSGEQKQLFLTAMNPAFYAASDPSVVTELQKLWMKFGNLLSKKEAQYNIILTIDELIRKYPEKFESKNAITIIEFL